MEFLIAVVFSIWFWVGIAFGIWAGYTLTIVRFWRPKPCGKHKSKWWMRALCTLGIHWHGRSDGGGMGDAYQCHVCGRDNYAPCFLVHDESKKVEPKKTECSHIFWPVGEVGNYTGQRCALCGHFNSIEDIRKEKEL